MTRDDITRMAREAGFVGFDGDNGSLRRFAALVAAAEREACAKVADSGRDPRSASDPETYLPGVRTASLLTANSIAAAIRARGRECT